MKVVLLAGGLGTRMREETEFKPKPMVDIGGKPVLWHIMKNFAHHGFREFVILGGYKAQIIKEFFLNFSQYNYDFTLTLGHRDSVEYHSAPRESDWSVTVLDTGVETPTGGRLFQARSFLDNGAFLCTYGDGLASVQINRLLALHQAQGRLATLTVARPTSRFGVVEIEGNRAASFAEKPLLDGFVNIGFFAFQPEIFSYLKEDSILEREPLNQLAREGQLSANIHSGFWQPLDTYREYIEFNRQWEAGTAPWKLWGEGE